MGSHLIRIDYYVDRSNKMPFWVWQKSLKDVKGKAVVLSRLNRIQLGNLGDRKFVGKGVYELRIQYGGGYRIYFGKEGAGRIVILCGGIKGTQKRDIGRAQEYWEEYRDK